MYTEYFGLKESAFSITPDPQYLYLSPRHKEALAHLLYGAGEGGGFVLLTGEVGTGKTTVCRAFLEQLPEHVDIALILNPALSAVELLQSICDEFHIAVESDQSSIKPLVDRLNDYLLRAHASGRRPVLMIDEAQNLRPDVLEQIRLLTNLETPKHKLLQIFLVGQPELRDLLQERHLRQLSQRITARFHLTPLDAAETLAYIEHRLAVAGVERTLFTAPAMRRIYRISGGVPRLINILCDRALLGTYATQGGQVSKGIVNRAATELNALKTPPGRHRARTASLAVLALCLTLGLGWLNRHSLSTGQEPVTSPAPITDTPAATMESPPREEALVATNIKTPPLGETQLAAVSEYSPAAPEQTPGAAVIDQETVVLEESTAAELILAQWSITLPYPLKDDGCALAASHDLQCRNGTGSWNKLRWINRPALLMLRSPGGRAGFGVLVGLDTEQATMLTPAGETRYPLEQLDALWFGDFRYLWKTAPGGIKLIGPRSTEKAVRWLRLTLERINGEQVSRDSAEDPKSGRFDRGLQEEVRRFQTRLGLSADGIAGPQTLVQLNSAAALENIPKLYPSP